jgi:hypothetical protein
MGQCATAWDDRPIGRTFAGVYRSAVAGKITMTNERAELSGVTNNEKCVVEFKAIFQEEWHRATSTCQGK